jgi:glucosamine-6-phosphate deaminase
VSFGVFLGGARLDSTVRQWTLSALQLHPWALIVVDEDATAGTSIVPPRRTATTTITLHLELHVKTVKYFKSIEFVQEQVEKAKKELQTKGEEGVQVGSVE